MLSGTSSRVHIPGPLHRASGSPMGDPTQHTELSLTSSSIQHELGFVAFPPLQQTNPLSRGISQSKHTQHIHEEQFPYIGRVASALLSSDLSFPARSLRKAKAASSGVLYPEH
jgi:hypothetical protein